MRSKRHPARLAQHAARRGVAYVEGGESPSSGETNIHEECMSSSFPKAPDIVLGWLAVHCGGKLNHSPRCTQPLQVGTRPRVPGKSLGCTHISRDGRDIVHHHARKVCGCAHFRLRSACRRLVCRLQPGCKRSNTSLQRIGGQTWRHRTRCCPCWQAAWVAQRALCAHAHWRWSRLVHRCSTRFRSRAPQPGFGLMRWLAQGSGHLQMGLVQSFRHIVRAEGFRALWRGLGPSVAGVAPARAVYFFTYSHTKRAISDDGASPLKHFLSAATAGCTTATLTSPIWVLKTRIQLQTNMDPASAALNPSMRNYTSYSDAILRMYREEGIRAFYKGLTASYFSVSEGAIQFTLYERMKSIISENGQRAVPKYELFGIAAVAKVAACSATYPLEVVRTRLREQRAPAPGAPHRYTGIAQALRTIAREEGRRGLYGGMLAHLLRVVPNAAIMFMVVETVLSNNL